MFWGDFIVFSSMRLYSENSELFACAHQTKAVSECSECSECSEYSEFSESSEPFRLSFDHFADLPGNLVGGDDYSAAVSDELYGATELRCPLHIAQHLPFVQFHHHDAFHA